MRFAIRRAVKLFFILTFLLLIYNFVFIPQHGTDKPSASSKRGGVGKTSPDYDNDDSKTGLTPNMQHVANPQIHQNSPITHSEPPKPFIAVGKSQRSPKDWTPGERDPYYNLIVRRVSDSDPGEGGSKVELTDTEDVESRRRFHENMFDVVRSDKIALDRTVKDLRHDDCLNVKYDSQLPTTSVVIIFVNEAPSTLLRTVVSVMNLSPEGVIIEIILVDDSSDKTEIKDTLPKFVTEFMPPVVKLVRTTERSGLTRARMVGSDLAKGEVILFLDSHCEASPGWLEPLLQRIKEDDTNVVMPSHDIISHKNFEFYGSITVENQGIFNWQLLHTWQGLPSFDKKKIKTKADPVRSPTMAGGLFAISRRFWEYLGKYDPGFLVWGGENLELSFKIWMCGGRLEIIPCSHVGHVFRDAQPYHANVNNAMRINQKRLAEVWLDEYKQIVYQNNPFLERVNAGDFSERIALRQSLKCQNFDWYLKNVVPDMYVPSLKHKAKGPLENLSEKLCLTVKNAKAGPVSLTTCIPSTHQQFFYTDQDEIRFEFKLCLEFKTTGLIEMDKCNGAVGQKWSQHSRQNKLIYNQLSGKCLSIEEFSSETSAKSLLMKNCDANDHTQLWALETYY